MTLSIHHIAINTAAPERLAALYGEAVGFLPVDCPGSVQWIAAPNAFVAIHKAKLRTPDRAKNPTVSDQGIGHFCIQSGDGPATWAALAKAGVAFNAEMTSLGGDYLYAYGRDPEGNLIEVEGMMVDPEPGPPWIAHVALVSADLERLAGFYARLIGRTPHSGGTFASPAFKAITGLDDVKVSAKWLMADNLIFEMWQYQNPVTQPASPPADGALGYRHIGFCCADLATERDRIAATGIKLSETSGPDGTQSLSGSDPDGNRFVIAQQLPSGDPLSLSGLARPSIIGDRHRAVLDE
jgi:catechol 2,3-dioxygenase-like lactoylglutathione lyase family enzyme